MKIAILTYWNSKENYGQLLQCYALQKFLIKNGHTPFLIKYKEDRRYIRPPFYKKIFDYIFRFPSYIQYAIQVIRDRRNMKYYNPNGDLYRNFPDFLEKYICTTEKEYNYRELFTEQFDADAYICGSDQIWGGDEAYYLPFAPKDKKIIAYAPSFGGVSEFQEPYKTRIISYLRRFNFLGIREESGVELCRKMGLYNAVKVVDPTLLLDVDDYNVIRKATFMKKNYLFLYLLGNPINCKLSLIVNFAKKMDLQIIYVASQNKNDKYEKVYPQIGEWVDYLANASFVITNSFHCTVFSLLYEKKFMTIPLSGAYKRMNTRVYELLHSVKLDSAIYRGNIEDIYCQNFDFSEFKRYKQNEVYKSLGYLSNLLK